MKKILFTAFSLVSMLFMASCSNDEITIDKTLPKHSVSYNVSTQDMYDTFGQTSNIRENYLREDTLCIGITTFVYDSNGTLINNKVTCVKNFNAVEQNFENLIEGVYTFITIETLFNPIKGNQSSSWRFDDVELLSTVKITQTSIPSITNIIGVSTNTINLSGDEVLTVTPKAIGSVINFNCYRLEKSNYVYVGFGTQDRLKYYSLNPQLQGKDRYHKDLTSKDTINIRAKTKPSYFGQGYKYQAYVVESDIIYRNTVQRENQINNNIWGCFREIECSLEEGKIYESGFYHFFDGVADSFFGDKEGLDKWKQEWDDVFILFKEPCLQWGASVETVKSYMTDYQYGNFKQTSDGDYNLWYFGKYRESEIDYYFDTSTDGLFTSVVFFDSNSVGEDEITSAFNELGYNFVKSLNEDLVYSKGNDTYIYFGLNGTNDWYVQYVNRYHTAAAPFRLNNESVRTRNSEKRATTYVKKLDKNYVSDQLMICEKAISKSLK